MERFARRHIAEHPEVATYVAGPTARLDQLDDDSATVVLRSISPAYFFDYWGREDDFGPARRLPRMYAAPSQGEGPPFDVRGELAGIGAPTLVLAGEADFICGPRWARLIHDDIPGAQLLILEGTGHLGHVENPDGFATAVITFLASVHVGTE
ncbi:alpha/beta fold hydrolase [Streptomyces sp. NPDC056909]|uniref:alpha/beta fold hydrolase n=1 Tax=Streptomyces sp. NPDC056909 TaxID=3345963 RepID=UPI0036A63794